ncbi:uncharacterized protein LOC143459548 [Clavelina lepadiformis]
MCIVPELNQDKPPSAQQKLDLFKCGLGEKAVTFAALDTKEELDQKLKSAFPPLSECGGYCILVNSGKGLINISFGPCEAMMLKKALGTGKVYLRPIQKNISLSSFENKSQNVEKCLTCGEVISLPEMQQHILEKHKFYGETALDTGGPRRDFFRIMIQAMMEKNIFEEKENNVTLCKNESLVHKQWYYVCGLVVGLSCLEGGDNIHLKEELLTEIGTDIYTKQFQQGLCKCGIMKLLTAFPVLKYIWTNPANRIVTVGKLLNNFKVNFSPEGSNSRKDEERAYSIFVSYVREVAGAGRKDFISINLQSILAYITGNSSIPVLGFNPPATISFQADHGAFLPQAHTCINQFVLSRVQHGANPETVKRGLDWAFSSMDFGAENV